MTYAIYCYMTRFKIAKKETYRHQLFLENFGHFIVTFRTGPTELRLQKRKGSEVRI